MACITKEVCEFAHVVGFFGLPWLCSRFKGKLIEDESEDCHAGLVGTNWKQ